MSVEFYLKKVITYNGKTQEIGAFLREGFESPDLLLSDEQSILMLIDNKETSKYSFQFVKLFPNKERGSRNY